MQEINALGRRIAEEFHPERVILFGSYAEGRASDDSDIDILVVLRYRGSGFRKSLEILNRIDSRLPIDLLARNPGDVRSRYSQGDPLIREALDRGKVLYERHR
jgi:predicted nucleotidyltransferase